jgi:hypothetical protein
MGSLTVFVAIRGNLTLTAYMKSFLVGMTRTAHHAHIFRLHLHLVVAGKELNIVTVLCQFGKYARHTLVQFLASLRGQMAELDRRSDLEIFARRITTTGTSITHSCLLVVLEVPKTNDKLLLEGICR